MHPKARPTSSTAFASTKKGIMGPEGRPVRVHPAPPPPELDWPPGGRLGQADLATPAHPWVSARTQRPLVAGVRLLDLREKVLWARGGRYLPKAGVHGGTAGTQPPSGAGIRPLGLREKVRLGSM